MEDGDWYCKKCNIHNFKMRSQCFKCGWKPHYSIEGACQNVKRQRRRTLGDRDWNCSNCDFLNFKRRIQCLKCGKSKI